MSENTPAPTKTATLSDEELRTIADEALRCMGDPEIGDRLKAFDLGMSLSERFYVYGVVAERLRSRARVAELERVAVVAREMANELRRRQTWLSLQGGNEIAEMYWAQCGLLERCKAAGLLADEPGSRELAPGTPAHDEAVMRDGMEGRR